MVEIVVTKFIAARSCVDKFDMTARSCVRCYKSNMAGIVQVVCGGISVSACRKGYQQVRVTSSVAVV